MKSILEQQIEVQTTFAEAEHYLELAKKKMLHNNKVLIEIIFSPERFNVDFSKEDLQNQFDENLKLVTEAAFMYGVNSGKWEKTELIPKKSGFLSKFATWLRNLL